MRLLVFEGEEDWLEAALLEFVEAARLARGEGRKACHFCLAGGRTPEPLYRFLASDPRLVSVFDGLAIHLWLSDERVVPEASVLRNGTMVAKALAGAAWPFSLHSWPACGEGERGTGSGSGRGRPVGTTAEAARVYARELEAALAPSLAFDLALLGLGNDGHTASLFAGDPLWAEKSDILARPASAPVEPRERLSLSAGILKKARRLRFLVRGEDKFAIVQALAADDLTLPAALLNGEESTILYCPLA